MLITYLAILSLVFLFIGVAYKVDGAEYVRVRRALAILCSVGAVMILWLLYLLARLL